MDTFLVKIFAMALALSQVTTRPEAVKTQFDPVVDRADVVQMLRAGCAHMRKAFDIEDLNLDELIATAMDDPQALTGEIKALRGLNFGDLHKAYRQFCKNETVPDAVVDIGQVIEFYNKALADLPDHKRLNERRLPGVSLVLDIKGNRFTEIFEPDHRRVWVPLSDIPEPVQKAFIAAEDKRFHQHKGIDERALIRAFIGNLAQPGRPQGGSTITQQVAKNLLVGDDVTYERKMREMIIASRLERTLNKAQILELYLNSIYLGRGAWGVEVAAQSYFGKPASALNLPEGALLAGLVKGPNYFNPDRHPERAQERLAYVLNRMQENGTLDAEEMQRVLAAKPRVVAYERQRRTTGLHFVDHLSREAKTLAGIETLTAASYVVRSTIHPDLQRATEIALQEGLARYERNNGRVQFQGAEANLAELIRKIQAENKPGKPAWQQALESVRLPLYDVHWLPALVLEKSRDKGVRVGLADGRVVSLLAAGKAQRQLNVHDVVYVSVLEGKGKNAARAELRVRPMVQGAALVLENQTGRILAMAGGFSYPLSQLNRATQAQRQPGSAFKPFTYLAALRKGLQPNTLVRDEQITLPPIGISARRAKPQDYWTPKNYDSGSSGVMTLRRALENSKNMVTARLLDGGIEDEPELSLDRVCELAMEAQLYRECVRHYPFVLGAQPVRLIDLAAFYAAVANEGARPSPHTIASIEQNGRTIYRSAANAQTWLGSADRAAFYQLKSMLQGVLQRGTARSIGHLAPYVGGKTGTTDDENDAWFVGFTNDVTVAVWVGYDNADGKRRTLGAGQTGSKVAIPIFEPILQAAWRHHAPKVALNPPSREAQRQLAAVPIDVRTGQRLSARGEGAFVEYFRLDRTARINETQYQLVPRSEAHGFRYYDSDGEAYVRRWDNYQDRRVFQVQPWESSQNRRTFQVQPWEEVPRPPSPGWRQPYEPRGGYDDEWRRPRRIDPEYFWSRRYY
jgi:penicillin-binding protein 1A